MKIIRLYPSNETEASYRSSCLPDTSLLIRQRPFFIPDFTNDCAVQLCAAVRIERLGRSISSRFASRYYHSERICLGVHFTARDLLNRLRRASLPADEAIAFDDCVAISESEVDCREDASKTILLRVGEKEITTTADVNHILTTLNNEIARFSEHYTLRQGDWILLPLTEEEVKAEIDERLVVTVGDSQILAFNIK